MSVGTLLVLLGVILALLSLVLPGPLFLALAVVLVGAGVLLGVSPWGLRR